MQCEVCKKEVTEGMAHLCGLELRPWDQVARQMETEQPPTIEEYEQAVCEHNKSCEEKNIKGVGARLPAEMVLLSDIKIGDRFRKTYKDIDELAASIKYWGLMQYPVIDEDNNLIAGGRRMRALTQLEWKYVPVVRKKFITPLKLREMELEENIQRSDLTWPETVALKDEIYKLKVAIYGEKGTGRAAANNPTGISQKDVAEIFGDSPANFTLDLQLARAIREIPELANCNSKDEARKKLKKMQEKLIVDELEKRYAKIQQTQEEQDIEVVECEDGSFINKDTGEVCDAPDPGRPRTISLYERAEKSFIIMDAIAGLKAIPDNSNFGFINIDTPYGIDLNNTKKAADEKNDGIIEHDYIEWDSKDFLELSRKVAEETFRVAQNCTMTWWFAEQWQQQLFEMLTSVGWKVDPVPCIWYTGLQGQTNQPELYLARTYEPFFHCRKGQPIINKRGRSNVFHFPKLTADKKIHPTEKPVPLMEELFATFAPQCSTVLVPFLGSGNDILAAYNTKRDAIGFDLNKEVKKRFLIRVAEMSGFKL